MPNFQEKWEALTERTRKVFEALFGAVLAVASWSFLRMSGSGSGSNPNNLIWTIAAAACVLFVPNIIEAQTGGNRLSLMRKCMLIGLVAMLAIDIAVALAKRGA